MDPFADKSTQGFLALLRIRDRSQGLESEQHVHEYNLRGEAFASGYTSREVLVDYFWNFGGSSRVTGVAIWSRNVHGIHFRGSYKQDCGHVFVF